MKVSICIPVYNVENLIGRCLDSVVNQSYSNLEIIIVNDCTPDNSMQIVNQYAQKDNRIKIINHEKNHGLMMTRKTGYTAATGDYITFCDSDDEMPRNSIKTLLNAAIMSNADIISGNIRFIKSNEVIEEPCLRLNYGNTSSDVLKSLLKNEYSHNLWAKLFKRKILQDTTYQTYDNFTNGEDACLFYQMLRKQTNTIHINEVVYNYIQNMSSSTNMKLSRAALRSIVTVNKLRIETCKLYPGLESECNHYVCTILVNLVSKGYNKDNYLKNILLSEGLDYYISFASILKNTDKKDWPFWLVKRYLQPLCK